ncbi:MAG: hypothetical protein HQK73_13040 [Desulfamplus sp.]|nr:hypothetical protein [Desulfamplus sp.]MBF0412814.1 hypothetical protein [Desulfamplus sp.]
MLIDNKEITTPDIELKIAKRQTAEYAMTFDLLAQIIQSETEKQSIESILNVFQTLFSPAKAFYISLQKDKQPEKLYSLIPSMEEEDDKIKSRLLNFDKKYEWTESNKGFRVTLSYKDNKLGLLEIDEISFPEYKEHYLNLTMSIIEVCALAIENARRNQRIKDTESQLRKEKENLEHALTEIKTLSGFLPICMHCKSIRDDKGYWQQMEEYIQSHSEAQFSHSICKNCAKKYYPDYDIYSDE